MIYIYIFRRISISYYFLCLRWLAIYIYICVCVYSRWFIHQKDGTCREAVSFVMARQIQDIFFVFWTTKHDEKCRWWLVVPLTSWNFPWRKGSRAQVWPTPTSWQGRCSLRGWYLKDLRWFWISHLYIYIIYIQFWGIYFVSGWRGDMSSTWWHFHAHVWHFTSPVFVERPLSSKSCVWKPHDPIPTLSFPWKWTERERGIRYDPIILHPCYDLPWNTPHKPS